MENVSNVPGCIEEIFENPESQWSLSDYEIPMDPDSALDYLLELTEIGPDCIIRRDPETVILGHPGYGYCVKLKIINSDVHEHTFESQPVGLDAFDESRRVYLD